MRIHLYDYLNTNKKATMKAEAFIGIGISHTIDDFSSANLSFSITEEIADTEIRQFDNIYVEDDDGEIIFGGVISGFSVKPTGGQLTCYDHRWMLTRLILEDAITLAASDDVLDAVEQLIEAARAKRPSLPIVFDRAGSIINPAYQADLKFEIGDDIGSCLQKIIQTLYARWQMRYYKDGNSIFGNLVVRSVRGVSPEGVGISRSWAQSEDGEVIRLFYGEGDNRSNMQDFTFTGDFSSYASRAKVGARINGNPAFFTADPDETSAQYEFQFGRTEVYVSDYNANSPETALALSRINQNYPRQDFDVLLSPLFTRRLNCGDRVSIAIASPLLNVEDGTTSARIDAVSYNFKDGYLERRVLANVMSPQKRTGTTGFLEAMSKVQQGLDKLDKNYFNS